MHFLSEVNSSAISAQNSGQSAILCMPKQLSSIIVVKDSGLKPESGLNVNILSLNSATNISICQCISLSKAPACLCRASGKMLITAMA